MLALRGRTFHGVRYDAIGWRPQQQVDVYDRDSGDGDGMPSAWETTFGLNPGNLTDANADADLDGVTNLQEYVRGTHPTAVASATRYFAEGAANAFFTTRLAAVNPATRRGGRVPLPRQRRPDVVGPAHDRAALAHHARTAGEWPTPGNDFSTVIESDRTVVVDRTMTWDSTGYGAHTETSIAAPSTTWHLAEGATHGAFDLFYLLQNPNDAHGERDDQLSAAGAAHADLQELYGRAEQPQDHPGRRRRSRSRSRRRGRRDYFRSADRRRTRDVFDAAGQPPFAAGHGAAGVTAPALRWFLAEGATGNFFDLYVLVANPNTTASTLKVTYLLPAARRSRRPIPSARSSA